MTEVIGKRMSLGLLLIFLYVPGLALGQDSKPPLPVSIATPSSAATNPIAGPAEQLYLQLRRIGLNPARTFKVRGATIDRPGLHLTFEDGMIAFTADVQDHVTGAFFEGDGEVLLTPSNSEERASMALGTGMAILEERVNTAYLRFNDQTFADLQPFLRSSPDAQEFAARFNSTAQNLAELDVLRLFLTFSRSLPVAQQSQPSAPGAATTPDHYLHARVEGQHLGLFDIHYDSLAFEQLSAGQSKTKDGVTYYDLWTSFTSPPPGSSARIESPPLPQDPVRINAYSIKTEVRPPSELSVDASLEVDVQIPGDRTLLFELSRFLQVKQVELNGRPVEFINNQALEGTQLARRGNDLVAVVFDQPLRAGDRFKLRFVYAGEVLSEAGNGLLYVGARGAWYPNRGLIPSAFDLTFRYPREWTLIATGTPFKAPSESEGPAPDNSALVEARWKTERPISLAGFNLGKYVKATAQAGTVQVSTYAARGVEKDFPHPSGLPDVPDARGLSPSPEIQALHRSVEPSPARHAQAVANAAAQSVEFFAQRFGPYPYHSLELTQMPGPISQGWPGLIFLSSLSFLSPEEAEGLHFSSERSSLQRLALAHETAHQWWGDLVSWKSYRDQWIVEALANYCALMKLETEHPAEFRAILEQYRKNLLEKNKDGESLQDAGPVTLGQRLSSSHFPDGYQAVSYGRGTWLFHMLRYVLLDSEARSPRAAKSSADTDEPFNRILRKISDRYAGQAIDTHQLLVAFAENLPPSLRYEGKSSLDWFEEGWVRGTALPQYSLRGVKFTPKAGSNVVSGVLLQKDAPSDLVTSVPIYAVIGGRNILLGRVFADGPETSFHLSAPTGASRVIVDPNNTLLTGKK